MLACADFHISPGSWHLKTDAPSRGERPEKCNQSMRIGEHPGDSVIYAERKAFVR
ncbi:enolase [mine drainage metagenome]|uniref:phosphopyruvate hydratase n=1 Tax=mine drainage metagenome TaxID=410659 RepID=A0A1J5SIL9_9ZZZZ